jgi:acyl carrier protein
VVERETIRAFVHSVVREELPDGDDESLFDGGVLDSFTLMALLGQIEKRFGIAIPESDRLPRKFETIEKIRRYVEARGGG